LEDKELLDKLLKIDENTDMNIVIKDYWRSKMEENEDQRYSKESNEVKEAFKFLR